MVPLHGQAVQLAKKAAYKPIIVEMMLDPQLEQMQLFRVGCCRNFDVDDVDSFFFCLYVFQGGFRLSDRAEAPGREGQQLVGFAGWCTGAGMGCIDTEMKRRK